MKSDYGAEIMHCEKTHLGSSLHYRKVTSLTTDVSQLEDEKLRQ